MNQSGTRHVYPLIVLGFCLCFAVRDVAGLSDTDGTVTTTAPEGTSLTTVLPSDSNDTATRSNSTATYNETESPLNSTTPLNVTSSTSDSSNTSTPNSTVASTTTVAPSETTATSNITLVPLTSTESSNATLAPSVSTESSNVTSPPSNSTTASSNSTASTNNGTTTNGSTSALPPTSSTTPEEKDEYRSRLMTGVGATVGVVVAIALIIGLVCYCKRRKSRHQGFSPLDGGYGTQNDYIGYENALHDDSSEGWRGTSTNQHGLDVFSESDGGL